MLTIQPLRQSQTPALEHSTGQCALKIWMVRGVATITKRDQVRGVVVSAIGTRNQVVNISFAPVA